MTKKNVVNVDFTALQSAITKMRKAKENLSNPVLTKMNSYDKLNVDDQINDALDKLVISINEIQTLLSTTQLSQLTAKLIAFDQTKNKVHKNTSNSNSHDEKEDKNDDKESGNSGKTGGSTKTETIKEVEFKEIKPAVRSVLLDKAKDLITDNLAVLPIHPTVNIRTQELQNLEKYLQDGDLVSAASSYKFLKTFGSESDAQALLAKYGYKVEEKDGEYVISKITEENPNPSTETETNIDNSSPNENTTNNTDNEVVAEETVNTEKEEPSTVVNSENNQNKTETVVNTSNTNHNNSSNNNYSSSNSNSQHVVENTSTEVNNADTTTQVETDAATTESTTDIGDSIKENTKDTSKSNVVSIIDDSETTTTKKSSGLGTAIPIGLGTIATGAAAVAGVRYVKNRHDNQEEYDESYDDENNNLDDNDEYIDSAQYDNGSSYMDDDYLGPADNNNSSEDSYVDPSDLEEIEDFSDDSVLEDLNSNY